MNSVLAIALLEIRAAVRSRLFVSLMFILLLVVSGLPATVKGDGTAAGGMMTLLYYTVGLAFVVLCLSTLWAGCAAISREIDEKQMQLVATKPVHRVLVWIGKWLGILAINAVLLTMVGIAVYAFACRDVNRMSETDRADVQSEILVGRRVEAPVEASLEREVNARVEAQKRSGNVPAGATCDDLFSTERKRLLAARSVVLPGQAKEWTFNLKGKEGIRGSSETTLRFRFTCAATDRKPVSGMWQIDRAGAAPFEIGVKRLMGGTHTVTFPASALLSDSFVVRFRNGGKLESNTAIFNIDDPVEILATESSFEWNLVRAGFILFCLLAVIAAIGLTAGAVFSFPVATFAAGALLVIAVVGHYTVTTPHIRHEHGDSCAHEVSLVERTSEEIVKRMHILIAPAMGLMPLARLSDGVLVSTADAARAFLILLVIYPCVIGLFGGYALVRRELALPGR